MQKNIAPISTMDMTHLARLLLSVRPRDRHALSLEIFANAERAANCTDPMVRNECGNGTISGAVQQYKFVKMANEPNFNDLDYLACWRIAIVSAEWHLPARRAA